MLDEVREFIERPDPGRFDDLALRVFRFQYEGNEPYRRFCDRLGRRPGDVGTWTEIPAVPSSAMKRVDLVVSGLGSGQLFLSSGTTEGASQRSRHRVPDPDIYRRSALAHFAASVLPDGARPRLLVLAPALAEEPQSSLCQMIAWIAEELGSGEAEYFVSRGELDRGRLVERLRAVELREPVLLIGITPAFVELADHCRTDGLRFRLPYASRIVDTGGTKRRIRPVSRNGLLRAFWETFGVPGYWVANEYGMTEMCSQFYDSSIRDHFDGRKRDRRKIGPPWVRTRVVSPETMERVSPGERGLLQHLDLANVGSVAALVTEDVGVEIDDGFEILGRFEGAEPRGCALLLREVVD